MISLNTYGWNNYLSNHKQVSQFSALPHGRVVVTHKTCYEVVAKDGFYQCGLSGNSFILKMVIPHDLRNF